jgi:transcriptional regulator with XRE-family HTH domain
MASRIASGRQRRPTFIRQWRQHRGLTVRQLAERLKTSAASISRLEMGDQPYSQEVLEAIADALACEPQDLISRKPGTETMWSLWEQAKPDERETITELARTILNRRAFVTEKGIRGEIRRAVAEHFATLFMAAAFESYSEQQVRDIARGIIDRYAHDSYDGIDPAQSDMLSAEAEDAAGHLIAAALDFRPNLRQVQAPGGSVAPRPAQKKTGREKVS